MKYFYALAILIFLASPVFAVPVCYDNADPAVVTAIGKSVPAVNETCFDHAGQFKHGRDNDFYTISGGKLVAKSQTAVDSIKAQKALDAQTAATKKANRIAEIKNKLTSMTPAQLNSYIDTNVTDLAAAKVYLKRLTLIVQYLAKESGR